MAWGAGLGTVAPPVWSGLKCWRWRGHDSNANWERICRLSAPFRCVSRNREESSKFQGCVARRKLEPSTETETVVGVKLIEIWSHEVHFIESQEREWAIKIGKEPLCTVLDGSHDCSLPSPWLPSGSQLCLVSLLVVSSFTNLSLCGHYFPYTGSFAFSDIYLWRTVWGRSRGLCRSARSPIGGKL